jgi:hypothetical protein
MLSRAQQVLLKRAQREAALPDAEYRDALETVSGCRSSKDASLTDRHLDIALAYLEAIHWQKVDRGELPPPCKPNAAFRQRGYWAAKNSHQETSRDRYKGTNLDGEVRALESSLQRLGYGPGYCAAIREKVAQGRTDPHAQHLYRTALRRTITAKAKQVYRQPC